MKPIDTEGQLEVTCPYCGYKTSYLEADIPNPYDEIEQATCDSCERTFKFQIDPITYTSWK